MYNVNREEAEERLNRRRARLSAYENKRLSILNTKSLNNNLTGSEEIEFEK
jgi:hypothetical protein